jgi:hypothetical protein
MPGSLARPPSHEHRDREGRRKTHRWARIGAGRRPWQRHRWCSHGCGGATPPSSGLRRWRRSTVPTAKRPSTAPHLGKMPGLQTCHPTGEVVETPQQAPRRGAETPARSSRSRSSRRGEIDQGDARRRWRRTTAKPTNRHSQMKEREEAERMPRLAMAEPVGARRNQATKSPAIHSRQREESD